LQVVEFLAEEIDPILARNAALLGIQNQDDVRV
jgi:hypothetical protein